MRALTRIRRHWALGAATVLVLSGGVAAGTHLASAAAAGCRVDYTVTNQWPGGFGTNVIITNLGDPITSWQFGWSFTAGQTITQLWSGTLSANGPAVTVKNVSYNGTLGAGASTTFGFLATGTSSSPALSCS